jgi:4-diphosphocytidyl-2-C-methyl-D-erythritol kinase
VLIDWADTLHLERREDGRLARHDLGPALPADDLCLRAARALQQASGTPLGADISILKRVPWGAGMGGGSSDAATTLLALNRLWGLHWPRERLARWAWPWAPTCPSSWRAQRPGAGHRRAADADGATAHAFAVVKPPAAIPTRDIFEHPLLKRDTQTVIVAGFPEGAEPMVGRLSLGGRRCGTGIELWPQRSASRSG